jgi:hypothetical protein
MRANALMSFSVEPVSNRQVSLLVPVINGTALTELVEAFERARNFEPVGGYGGLIPDFFDYGPLDRYFMSDFEPHSHWLSLGGIYVLGCESGEVVAGRSCAKLKETGKTWCGSVLDNRTVLIGTTRASAHLSLTVSSTSKRSRSWPQTIEPKTERVEGASRRRPGGFVW